MYTYTYIHTNTHTDIHRSTYTHIHIVVARTSVYEHIHIHKTMRMHAHTHTCAAPPRCPGQQQQQPFAQPFNAQRASNFPAPPGSPPGTWGPSQKQQEQEQQRQPGQEQWWTPPSRGTQGAGLNELTSLISTVVGGIGAGIGA